MKNTSYEATKAFIKSGSYGFFTMGILLFSDPSALSWITVIFKLIASTGAGFLTGAANKLGGIYIEHLKNKRDAKREEKDSNKAA